MIFPSFNKSSICVLCPLLGLTQEVVGAQAAQRWGHPVDGDTEQLQRHLSVCNFCVVTELTIILHTI